MRHVSRLKSTPVTIGVIGSGSGTGVTHLSIMLAGFLSSKEQYKTALIELNHAGSFEALGKLYGEKWESGERFCLNGIDYYCGLNVLQMAHVFQRGYEYLILDLGHDWEVNQYELLRCNMSCIVGNCTAWRLQQFSDCIEQFQKIVGNQPHFYLSAFGVSKLRKELERQTGIRIDMIPVESTPFLLQRKNLAFFERFL